MTNFIDVGIHKIYLAGLFFTGGEPAQNKQAADILRGKGFEVFVPREHAIENGEKMSNEEWSHNVFDMDVNAINQNDCIVLLYYGLYSDSGTAWECGYAYALGKPVIVVKMTNPDKEDSLMINSSSYAIVNGLKGLADYDFSKMPSNKVATIQK